MRLCFFSDDRLGLVEGSMVRDVTDALKVLPAAHYPYPVHDAFIAGLSFVIDRIRKMPDNGKRLDLRDLTLQCPVRNPGKLVAAPVNYLEDVQPCARSADRGDWSVFKGDQFINRSRRGDRDSSSRAPDRSRG
jgi:hypothetical protein